MSELGFQDNALKWLANFLKNRKQRVKVDDIISELRDVISGTTQGTTLGVILYLLFACDLPKVVQQAYISIFADDTKLYLPIKNSTDSVKLQQDLDRVYEWSQKWQLNLNPSKSQVLVIANRRPAQNPTYYLGGNPIDVFSEVTDLGVCVDSTLKFSSHCNIITRKAYFVLRNLFIVFKSHDVAFYLKMYCTYVRPIIENASVIWSPINVCDVDKLERVQKYFTRKLPGMSGLCYIDRLRILHLESLEERRCKTDIIVFKQLQNCDIFTFMENFEYCVNNRRSHGKLKVMYSRTNTRRHYWSNRVIKIFNSSCFDEIRNCNYTNFKRIVKKC